MARTLYHIPAWHNRVDCGVDEIPQEYEGFATRLLRHASEDFWQRAEIYWDAVETALDRLALTGNTLYIFSDSVHNISAEMENAMLDAARKGSRHQQVVLQMLYDGGKLMITEDDDRIEYDKKYESGASLERRDAAIARNINDQLDEEHTGVLILGMAHKTWKTYLDPDIAVIDILPDRDVEILEERLG